MSLTQIKSIRRTQAGLRKPFGLTLVDVHPQTKLLYQEIMPDPLYRMPRERHEEHLDNECQQVHQQLQTVCAHRVARTITFDDGPHFPIIKVTHYCAMDFARRGNT